MKKTIYLATFLLLAIGWQIPNFADEPKREVTVRKLSPAKTNPLSAASEGQPLELLPEEIAHYNLRKSFVEELRREAVNFKASLETVKDPDERARKVEEFRASRVKKIDAFIAAEKNFTGHFAKNSAAPPTPARNKPEKKVS